MPDAQANHLMDPDAVQAFCEEDTAERNRLKAAAAGNSKEKEQALARAKRGHQNLERDLAHTPAPDTVVFHPSMAEAYRERVSRLIRTHGTAEGME